MGCGRRRVEPHEKGPVNLDRTLGIAKERPEAVEIPGEYMGVIGDRVGRDLVFRGEPADTIEPHQTRGKVDLGAWDTVLVGVGDRSGAMRADDPQHRPGIDDRAAGLVLGQDQVLQLGAKRRGLPQCFGRKARRRRPRRLIDERHPG